MGHEKKKPVPCIEEAFQIEVTKTGKEWRADALKLPGAPICGLGKTRHEALYSLCTHWLYMIADANYTPKSKRSPDSCYVPLILETLKNDLDLHK